MQKQEDRQDARTKASVIAVKENANLVVVIFGSINKSKKILKNIRLGLDEYNTFMIEYICKGKGGILPTKKKVNKGEKRNESYLRN